MTKDEAKHLSSVAAMGCCICEKQGYRDTPAEIHHIRTGQGMRRADHFSTIPLCPWHHRGMEGIHHLGRKAWERKFETTELDLLDAVRARLGSGSSR